MTTAYGSQTALNTILTTSHSQTLSGLSANTLYHYRVKSKDAAGNLVMSGDQMLTTQSTSPPSADCPLTNIRCVPNEYATIQTCLTAAQPGDTCFLAAGTYTESPTTVRNGSPDNLITITGADPANTIIATGRLTIAHSYHKLTGVRIQGNYLSILDSGAHHNTIEGNEFTGGAQGVYFQDSAEAPDGTTGPSFNLITNNTFYMGKGNGMVAMNGHDNTVSFNIFRDNNGYGALRVWGANQTISDNKFLRFISGTEAGISNHFELQNPTS